MTELFCDSKIVNIYLHSKIFAESADKTEKWMKTRYQLSEFEGELL